MVNSENELWRKLNLRFLLLLKYLSVVKQIVQKRFAKNKDSEVQKYLSYIEQQLDTIRDMKYEESRDDD